MEKEKKEKKEKTLLVNLLAGPGTGKSTVMAGVFSALKFKGVNCEMAPEFAKEKVWEGSYGTLEDQIYIFGKQLHKIRRLMGKVDVIITDSPLLFSLIYGHKECKSFKKFVLDIHDEHWNLNVFLNRKKKYNKSGRMQSEDEAKALDKKIKKLLKKNEISHIKVDSGVDGIKEIADAVIDRIGEEKQIYK